MVYKISLFLIVINCILIIGEEIKITSSTLNSSINSNNKPIDEYLSKSLINYSEPKLSKNLSDKSHFDKLINNQDLLRKQTLGISLANESKKTKIIENDFNNQFSQSLYYLIKYIERQNKALLNNSMKSKKYTNETLLKRARNLDRENCLLRLICEISSNQEDASDNDLIKQIRIIFSKKHQAPAYINKKDFSFPFYYAGHVGSVSGNAELCLETFPLCSINSNELLKIVKQVNKYTKSNYLNQLESKNINKKIDKEFTSNEENKKFSDKMRNKMKKLYKNYVKKLI